VQDEVSFGLNFQGVQRQLPSVFHGARQIAALFIQQRQDQIASVEYLAASIPELPTHFSVRHQS